MRIIIKQLIFLSIGIFFFFGDFVHLKKKFLKGNENVKKLLAKFKSNLFKNRKKGS